MPEWKFSQVFGERTAGDHVEDVDVISAIEFESRGEYLATGDHGGRIVLFARTDVKDQYSQKALENMDYSTKAYPKYMYKTEFQSHEPEFEYLRSLDIEEKINKLRWCAASNNSLFILSTNDRTIKLWKASNLEEGVFSRCRRVYARAHDYNINSISNNSDGETFISADDLRINLWNMEISNQCFNIVDMKPLDMEDLVEVITCTEFHPAYCNLLAYSSSRGSIRLVDMRQSALCDQNARMLQDREPHGSKSFFTEIVASISDMKFSKDGRHILSRDYMNLKLWDLHMESSPLATFKVHEYLRPKLSEMYNNDSIFDKFDCCLSRDGLHLASGSYNNTLKIFSRDDGLDEGIALEASRNPNRISHFHGAPKTSRLLTSLARGHKRRGHGSPTSNSSNGVPCDLTSKLSHLAWHPTADLIACAAANSLYMFHA